MALALGGYCVLVSITRGPVAAAAPAPRPPAPLVLPEPDRLPAFDVRAVPAPAANQRPPVTPFVLVVRVRGLPAALRTETGGVALARADGRGGDAWLPWPGPTPKDAPNGTAAAPSPADAAGELEVQLPVETAGEYVASVATAREFGGHGYVARAAAVCSPSAPVLAVDAAASEVTFRLAPGAKAGALLRLGRTDDPHWSTMATLPTGLVLERAATPVWLGHGTYELSDPLRPERRETFLVPATREVVVSAELAAPRGGRP